MIEDKYHPVLQILLEFMNLPNNLAFSLKKAKYAKLNSYFLKVISSEMYELYTIYDKSNILYNAVFDPIEQLV